MSKRDVTAIKIMGTGHYVPEGVLTSAAMDVKLGHALGYVQARSGVIQRRVAANNQSAAMMAAEAAKKALLAAEVSLLDIDCIVAASATMDQGLPCNAALIHEALGLTESNIPAFDVNASCLGFIAALDVIRWMLVAGRYRKVLVVASDIASCGLNWNNLEESAIFGDGAAAAVFSLAEQGEPSCVLACQLQTYSKGAHLCEIPAGGSRFHPSRIDQPFEPLTKFHMDGKRVFRLTADHFDAFYHGLLDSAELTLNDIDWIVPHQASLLGLRHMAKRLQVPWGKIISIFPDYGNQVAASLPTALDVAVKSKNLQRGQKLLLLGTGAGLSVGGAVVIF